MCGDIMKFDSSTPIYMQIIDFYKKEMIRGSVVEGDKIYSQREFALKYRVNPNTVQRAYREMEAMGLVKTERGQGTFVSLDQEALAELKAETANTVVNDFTIEMMHMGFSLEETLDLIKNYWKNKRRI